MFENLSEDLQRYGSGTRQQMRAAIIFPRLWAIAAYRFTRWIHTAAMPRLARRLLMSVTPFLTIWIEVATTIELSASAEIGPGLFLPHPGYIVVGAGSRIGCHCTLGQGVTIGHRAGGTNSLHESPFIGDRVYVGPGAIIIGPITIGDDAVIGAGAVVTRSVQPRGVAVGNPARVISRKGSFDLIFYPGREEDSERRLALIEGERELASQCDLKNEPVETRSVELGAVHKGSHRD
jgi:serine O-acetyltransferase